MISSRHHYLLSKSFKGLVGICLLFVTLEGVEGEGRKGKERRRVNETRERCLFNSCRFGISCSCDAG